MIRRELLLRLPVLMFVPGACRGGEMRPVLDLGVGLTVEEIDARSSLKMRPFLERPTEGAGFITYPHSVIYDDRRLKFTFANCGQKPSMPTHFVVENDRLLYCVLAATGDYIRLGEALQKSETLMLDLERQGFRFSAGEVSKFFVSSADPSYWRHAAPKASSFIEVKELFLNPDYDIAEMIVFAMTKDGLRADLRIKNMRRAFPNFPVTVVRDKNLLESEAVYYLEVNFGTDLPLHDGDQTRR